MICKLTKDLPLHAIFRCARYENTIQRVNSQPYITVTDLQNQHRIKSVLSTREQIHAGNTIIIMYFSFSPSPPSTSYKTAPMDIPSTSSSRPQSPSCAYPSWPRRSSLSSESSCHDEISATSYISDEDLFPCVFDDAEQDCTPPATPNTCRSPASCEAQIVVDNGTFMRELIAQDKARKERRRRRSGSSRKSRTGSSTKHMSPILEVGE